MDDIFFYILVIIIIIIIIIVLYNYNKNIENFSLDDLSLLYCHVFKKVNGDFIDDFPRFCNNDLGNSRFKHDINIPNNKGDEGDNGNIYYSYNDIIDYPRKCGDCNPTDTTEKIKIESINNNNNLTISPSIITSYTINTNEIIFHRAINPPIINSSNISILKELTNSYKKCESNQYNDKIGNIFNKSSIGECTDCPGCGNYQYSTCGGNTSMKGECIDCTECPDGEYLEGCGNRSPGQCKENICNCDNGTPSQGIDCPENGTNHCQYCDDHYELDNTTCSVCAPLKPENSTYIEDSCEWECNQNYTIDPITNSNECLIQCGEGYRRDANDNTCIPCGEDYYKEGPKNLAETCTPCDPRSTTNGNRTASSKESCQSRYGYEKNDSGFSLSYGYREGTTPGTIESCDYNYGRDNQTSPCVECPPLSNGQYNQTQFPNDCTNIDCDPRYQLDYTTTQCVLKDCGVMYLDIEGNCQDTTQYGDGISVNPDYNTTLVLSENYSWDDSRSMKSMKCEVGKRRNGEVPITDDNFATPIPCYGCQDLNDNETYVPNYGDENKCNTECISDDYTYDLDSDDYPGCTKLCGPGYYREDDSCKECQADTYKAGTNTNTSCTACLEGTTTDGITGLDNENQCLKKCDEGYYRNEDNNECTECPVDTYKEGTNTNTSCTPCDSGYTTNGLEGQTKCDEKNCPAGEFMNSDFTCSPCPDDQYISDDPHYQKECKVCDHNTRCDDNEILSNCGGDNEGTCTPCPESQKRHPTANTCINYCGENAYYNETACPDNSEYDQVNRICVCKEGFELNDSGDGCVRSLLKLVGEPCSSGEDCYSDMCDSTLVNNSGTISYENRCKGREYGDTCDTAEKHCSTSLYCTNGRCGPIKLSRPCNGESDNRCVEDTQCQWHREESQYLCL